MTVYHKKKALKKQSKKAEIKPVAFYSMEQNFLEENLLECKLISRAGDKTAFDDMISINKTWMVMRKWKKLGNTWSNYWVIAASNQVTGKCIRMNANPREDPCRLFGLINYSDLRFYVSFYKKSLEIFVYRGEVRDLLQYLDKCKNEYMSYDHWVKRKEFLKLVETAKQV